MKKTQHQFTGKSIQRLSAKSIHYRTPLFPRKCLCSYFCDGELYLFHSANPICPAMSSLWGIFDRVESGVIYLESSSRDLQRFRLWHPLPAQYRYCRLATRMELKDYVSALMWHETHNGKGPP